METEPCETCGHEVDQHDAGVGECKVPKCTCFEFVEADEPYDGGAWDDHEDGEE